MTQWAFLAVTTCCVTDFRELLMTNPRSLSELLATLIKDRICAQLNRLQSYEIPPQKAYRNSRLDWTSILKKDSPAATK